LSRGREIASDTGPLITLEKLSDGYRFIRLLYDRLIIPHAVLEELTQGQFVSPQAYLKHYGVEDLLEVVDVGRADLEIPRGELLDTGEREAIHVALKLGLPLLIEKEAGRECARSLGLQISGIAGQIVKAFRAGLIAGLEAEDKLRGLLEAGRINKKIHSELVATVQRAS
jgi:predicted nucleic acid-binding protein